MGSFDALNRARANVARRIAMLSQDTQAAKHGSGNDKIGVDVLTSLVCKPDLALYLEGCRELLWYAYLRGCRVDGMIIGNSVVGLGCLRDVVLPCIASWPLRTWQRGQGSRCERKEGRPRKR